MGIIPRGDYMIVAVEGGLENVRQALRQDGYTVVGLEDPGATAAAAVIVSGMDDNYLQQQARATSAPVIAAEGKTAEEILADLKKYQGEQG
ncbi:MAG: YkuS family protein [Clostridia bacterium]|nr:MAG: YkuS family protein [Clostridia bacterium]